MNKQARDAWLELLKTKEQTKQVLRQVLPDATCRYCVLGVLCLAYEQAESHHQPLSGDEWSDGVLPIRVVDWAGLDESDPAILIDEYVDEDEDGDRD